MVNDKHEITDRLQFARNVAAEASRFILRYYHSASLAVDWKREPPPSPRPTAGPNS